MFPQLNQAQFRGKRLIVRMLIRAVLVVGMTAGIGSAVPVAAAHSVTAVIGAGHHAGAARGHRPTDSDDRRGRPRHQHPGTCASDRPGHPKRDRHPRRGRAVNTTTVLTASPSPAAVAQAVTLTATVTAADGSSPAGSVRFQSDGTVIGSPVIVSGGAASTTATFATAGTESLSAVFTPARAPAYKPSTGLLTVAVQAAGTGSGAVSGDIPLALSVPSTGSFTLTVAPGTVTLVVSGSAATAPLNSITVTDNRNAQPGWSVSGQARDFSGSGAAAGATISGNQLGWAPTGTSLATGAALGPTVAPGRPGLGDTAAVLASAAAGGGAGTSLLGADLTLAIPPAATPGPYGSTITITATTSMP